MSFTKKKNTSESFWLMFVSILLLATPVWLGMSILDEM